MNFRKTSAFQVFLGTRRTARVCANMDTPAEHFYLLSRHFGDHDELKDQNKTPRDASDPWGFTPSILDSTSFGFPSFVNHPPGYYTPTPGGNTAYHNQAGDLHTPGMGFNLGTPLSMPTSDGNVHPTSTNLHGFQPSIYDSQHFQSANLFPAQQSYAPSSFVHQDSGFDPMEASNTDSPVHEVKREVLPGRDSTVPAFPASAFEPSMPAPPLPTLEKYVFTPKYLDYATANVIPNRFRYRVTLSAPTAMIRHPEEIPVTYLNKGQAYAMSITDTLALRPSNGPIKYRTVIRISFEDEQQRQRPSACWQLWKEGRGLAEAHVRGGKLQAVEYVDSNQGSDDDSKRPRVELERSSFDCFSVVWTPPPSNLTAECSVAMRFNFLSTDFSHSKGVKGIPVRLCAKTEMVSSGTPDSPPGPGAEVCFCKVKLFRDHGAERKLSNDVAHIKKTIEKVKQQIAQLESGTNEFGKRKRSGSIVSKNSNNRPSKVPKHKRTWSISSQGSTGRNAAEDDLHVKHANIQAMFTSTRPFSSLYLRGYEQDDPDLFPVLLPGEPQDPIKSGSISRKESWDHQKLSIESDTTPTNSCMESPTPSSHSVHSQSRVNERVEFQISNPFDPPIQPSNEWENFTHFSATPHFEPLQAQAASAVKIQRPQTDSSLPAWIDAVGVDPTYKAPPERLIKPIACFYILIKVPGDNPDSDYYRSVYLMARTARDLVSGIATKCNVDPAQITRTIRVNPKGIKIMVEDDTVKELPEGQDMLVEFSDMELAKASPSRDRDTTPSNSNMIDDGFDSSVLPKPLEMRLLY